MSNDQKVKVRSKNPSIRDKIIWVITILENCKFDLMYLDRLKMPPTADQEAYFKQEMAKIDSAIKFLEWLLKTIEIIEPKPKISLQTRFIVMLSKLWTSFSSLWR